MEIEQKFKVGDIVVLKSGGPYMTVKSLCGRDVECIWFLTGSREMGVQNHTFHQNTLMEPKKE